MPDAPQGSRTILVIDEDPRVGRLVRLSLHNPMCEVLTCTRHLEGLRIAARQKPDLILMETAFKGIDGIHLGGKLLQAPETQRSAVAFLTSDESLSRRVRAIQMGACDYLSKPIQGRSLTNRVTAIFERLSRGRRGPVAGPAVEPLRVKLEELESGGGSATICLQRGSQAARIVLLEGSLQSAECGPLRDVDALNEIAAHGDWLMSFDGSAPAAAAAPPTQRQRRITDQTRPAVPSKPFKHVEPSLAATVMDQSVSQSRLPQQAPRLAPEPELPELFSEDEQTVIDPRQQVLDGEDDGQAALDEAIATASLLAGDNLDATTAMDEDEIAAAEAAIAAEELEAEFDPDEPPIEGEPTGDESLPTPVAPLPRLAPEPSSGLVEPPREELTAARLTEHPPEREPTGEQLTVGRVSRASVLGRPPVEQVPTAAAGPAARLAAAGQPRMEKPRLEMPTVDDEMESPTAEAIELGSAYQSPGAGGQPRVGQLDAETAETAESAFVDLPANLPEPGAGFDEEMPTAMNFRVELDDPSFSRVPVPEAEVRVTLPLPDVQRGGAVPFTPASGTGVPATSPSGAMAQGRGDLQSWLAAQGAPLLLVGAPTESRETLQAAVEQLGFNVTAVSTGLDAYTTALAKHPVAILADQRGPELDGRELLAAVRSDFQVRETPFLIVSSDFLASQMQNVGPGALAAVVQGLESALTPRVQLEEHLRDGGPELKGWVEPIGAAHLLRALGRAGLSGMLELVAKDRRADVVFRRGEICGASVTFGDTPTVGPLALLNLLGYEWQEYRFVHTNTASAQVPLGGLDQLIETAFQQNNILLAKIYQHGFDVEDIQVDFAALEQFVQKLPAGSQELGHKLIAGECAAVLVDRGAGTPGLLKSLLHELRRKAILQALSMRPARLESDRGGGEAAVPRAPSRRGRRWLVIVAATLITVGCAVGGYFFYKKLRADRALPRPETSAPRTSGSR
jgi:DNA-binding response OmpR family regulator